MDYNKELELLEEYMSVYIQLLPFCLTSINPRFPKAQLPTFEYFKETQGDIRYSLSIPHYKDSMVFSMEAAKEYLDPCKGMGISNGIRNRKFNYWMGCKYYTNNNVNGEFKNVSVRDFNLFIFKHILRLLLKITKSW